MELFLAQSLLFLSLVFLYLFLQFLTTTTKPITRGFKTYPLVGSLPEILKNRHRFLDWTTQVLRDCPTNTALLARPGKLGVVITANPDNVEHILKTKFENYPKGDRFIYFLEDFMGRGIFNSDGELWIVQRKIASYEFNTKSLQNFLMDNVTVETQTRLLPILSRSSAANTVLDLRDILERFAFDNICMLAFGVDPGCLGGDGTAGAEFMRAFEDATMLSSERFMGALPLLWKIKRLFNVGTERRLRESIATIHEFADEIIRSRIEAKAKAKDPNKYEDLLSRFMGSEDSSLEFLRDIIVSFIIAGREATSSALSWFFWILSSRPDVKRRIVDELETVRSRRVGGAAGEAFGYEELKKMHYLHAAISETLRLYPPVAVDTRACLNNDVLPDGTMVKKDLLVMYHIYAMGRMESVWGKDCTDFKPERWFENDVYRAESPFRFPVFNAGPRTCLGKDMAYIQMKSVAASVMERFEIDPVDKDTCPELLFSLTLKMKGGLPVSVRVRERDNCT